MEFESGSNLKTISTYLFYKSAINSIAIPDTVTTIDLCAFSGSSISEITIPSSVTIIKEKAFADCKALVKATINAKVTKLGTSAFSNCPKLKEVTLPEALTTIDNQAFYKCTALHSIQIPDGVKTIDANAFAYSGIKDITLPSTVTAINGSAFLESKLESISLNEGLTTISQNAFKNTLLISIVLPSTLTTLGKNCFYGCKALEVADLSKTDLTSIPAYTFYGCAALLSINAPQIESIDTYGLYGTKELKALNMPKLRAVYYYALSQSGIESMVFAKSNEASASAYIGASAFERCTNLAKLELPNDLDTISPNAFRYCARLQNVKIPEYTKTICAHAFANTQIATFTVMNKKLNIYESALYSTEGEFSDSLIIKGFTDSTAKEYADEHNITFLAIDEGDEEFEEYIPTDEEIAANKLKGAWCNGSWKISTKALYIYGEGEMDSNIAIDGNGDARTFAEIVKENNITRILFGDGITTIADEFLYLEDDANLSVGYVFVPNTLERIGAYAFANTGIIGVYPNNGTFTSLGASLKYFLFPYSVTEIGEYAFANCTGLSQTTVMLPFDLTEISEGLFYNSNAQNVGTLGKVQKVGKKAFANCNNLASVEIPCNAVVYEDEEHPENNAVGFNSNGGLTAVNIRCRTGSPAYEYAQKYGLQTTEFIGEAYAYGAMTATYKSGAVTTKTNLTWTYYPEDNQLLISEGTKSSNNSLLKKEVTTKLVAPDADTQATITENTTLRSLIETGSIPGFMGSSSSGSRTYEKGSMVVDKIVVDEGITELSCSDLFSAFNPKHIVLPESLTTLNYHSFRGCDRLETVYIPQSVTEIEENAFADSYNLTGVNLGGVKRIDDSMFENRKQLQFVNMNKVEAIGKNAFSRCLNLQEIVIPDTTKSIGTRAFYKCIKAQEITLGSGITSIAENAFDDIAYCEKITVNSNLLAQTTKGAFNEIGTSTLGVDLIYGNNVENADFSAFCNTKVININLGANVKSISNTQYLPYAKTIKANSSNKTFFVNNNCLYDNTNKFVYAPAMEDKVVIKDGTTAIGDYALYGSSMVGVSVPTTVKSIGSFAFANSKSLKNLDINKGTTYIGNNAFENCTALRSFYAPSTLTTIGDAAFKNCNKIASVILPTKLASVGAEAFMGCSSLVGMVVSENTQSIGDRAYMDCENLEEIYIWYDTQLGNNVFDNDSKLTIYTMAGSDAYRYARENGVPYSAYTDDDIFYDLCGEKLDIYAGYLGFCTDGHGDIQWLTVYSADCENDGYIIGVCEYCSEILDEKHINAYGHDYKLTARVAPTQSTRGMKAYTCQNCGETFCEYIEATDEEAQIETHKVTGSVLVSANKNATQGLAPVRNASLMIDGVVVAKTDKDGRFELVLETGTYEVQITYAYGFTRTIYIVVEDEDLEYDPIPIIACDFNRDGKINNEDLALFRMVISSSANDLSYLDYVDMNGDGFINGKDLGYIIACNGINSNDYTYSEVVIEK